MPSLEPIYLLPQSCPVIPQCPAHQLPVNISSSAFHPGLHNAVDTPPIPNATRAKAHWQHS